MQAPLSFNNPHRRPAPPQLHCTHYMGRELGDSVGSLINEHDDTGYKSHWYSTEHTMATQKRKKKKHGGTEDEDVTSMWASMRCNVQYGGQGVCGAENTGGWSYMMCVCVCVLLVSFSSYTVITWMRLTARLFPSSALPLSPSLHLFLSHS